MLEFIDRTVIPFFLGLYDAVGYLGVLVAIGLETFIPIIPSEVIVPMAGWKVSQSAADPSILEPLTHAGWNWLIVLVIATLGAVAGSLAGYLIGAWGGRPLLDRWGRYVHIKPDDLDRADAWFARYGDRAVFFARLVPLLRALISYPAGVARMPVGRFLLFSTLGSLPWNAALLLAGYLLGENYRHLYDAIRPFELLIYAVVLVGVVYVIYRWLRGRARTAEVAGLSMSQRDLTFNIARLSPKLGELLEEHLAYYDDLLVHLFFGGDVTPHIVGLLRDGSASARAELEAILAFLETRFVQGDEDEQNVIAVSFLEQLPHPEEDGREIRYMLGPGLTGQLKVIWPSDAGLGS